MIKNFKFAELQQETVKSIIKEALGPLYSRPAPKPVSPKKIKIKSQKRQKSHKNDEKDIFIVSKTESSKKENSISVGHKKNKKSTSSKKKSQVCPIIGGKKENQSIMKDKILSEKDNFWDSIDLLEEIEEKLHVTQVNSNSSPNDRFILRGIALYDLERAYSKKKKLKIFYSIFSKSPNSSKPHNPVSELLRKDPNILPYSKNPKKSFQSMPNKRLFSPFKFAKNARLLLHSDKMVLSLRRNRLLRLCMRLQKKADLLDYLLLQGLKRRLRTPIGCRGQWEDDSADFGQKWKIA